jgi:hypothetical protein
MGKKGGGRFSIRRSCRPRRKLGRPFAKKRGDGFDGFGKRVLSNQNDDAQDDAGESNAPVAENPDDDANKVSDDDDSDDVSFDAASCPFMAEKGDDDQVDAGESNAPVAENPDDDANKVSHDDDSDDVSFVEVSPKKVAKKGNGFDEFGKPAPDNLNFHDDQVDAGKPNAPAAENPNDEPRPRPRRSCRSLNGCGNIFCSVCYP